MRMRYLLVCLLVAVSCLPKKSNRDAVHATENRQWDEAFRLWTQVIERRPSDTKARLEVERARMNAALLHLSKADRYFQRKKYPEAAFELNLVLAYDPENLEGIRMAETIAAIQEMERARKAGEAAAAMDRTDTLPQLTPSTWAPLDLKFVQKNIKDIYMSLGLAYGINIMLDKEIRDDKITVDLRNLNFIKALDTLMVVNRHFFKVIDDNTVIILADSKANRDRYDNQVIRTFYLSNITPQDLKAHLRQLGGIKEFAENEKLNAITIKGTPEQVALAEKIIVSNDKAQPEVVIEIELLEINRSKAHKIGLQPVDLSGNPVYRFGVVADPVSRSDDDRSQGGIRGIFPSLNDNDFLTIVPALAIDFLKEHGDSKQISNPHLRVTSGEKGMIRIGQSIPIVNTSFTTPNLSGSAGGTSNFGDQALTSFDYREVGIKINVVPRVHFNNEITLELELEVSSVLSGGLQPVLGQRQVTTSIRLKNGETNVLAGLLTNEERKSLVGFPGLMDIPILGRLFSSDEKTVNQTDIILTLRPVIIRGPNITESDSAPYEISSLRLSSLYSKESAKAHEPVPGGAGEPTWSPATNEAAPATEEPDESTYPSDDPDRIAEETALEETPSPAMLAFTPAALDARQDDTLEFNVFITNVDNLNRGEFRIKYDPAILQTETVDIGDFFNSGSGLPHVVPSWDNRTGTISLVVTQRHGAEPFAGAGILASVRFRALAPGSGSLIFDKIKLETPDAQDLAAEALEATYEVSP